MNIDDIDTARLDESGNLVLTGDTVVDGDLAVDGHIRCENGRRYNLKVKGDIDAGNIDAGDIYAVDIYAWNIAAGNIDAGDIAAGNINADGDLAFYAYCIAYHDITVQGKITGRRSNHVIAALDGEVTEHGKQTECPECGRPLDGDE